MVYKNNLFILNNNNKHKKKKKISLYLIKFYRNYIYKYNLLHLKDKRELAKTI